MSKKTYEVYWTENNRYKMYIEAKSKSKAEKLFKKWYDDFDSWEKKVKPEQDLVDGQFEFDEARERKTGVLK